jgi:apolipoprotein N-acyltransferase
MGSIPIVISALIYGFLFPPYNLSFPIFFIFIPLLDRFVKESKLYRVVQYSFLFGVFAAIASIYWILENRGASLPIRLLSGSSLFIIVGVQYSLFGYLTYIVKKLSQRWFLFYTPIIWVSVEYLLHYDELSFPWVVPYLTLSDSTNFIQIADIIGAPGVSGVVILFNLLIYKIYGSIRLKMVKPTLLYLLLVSAVSISIISYGKGRVDQVGEQYRSSEFSKVGIVHLSLGAEEKWERSNKDRIVNDHLLISDSLSHYSPNFILWGETNYPGYLLNVRSDLNKIKQFCYSSKIPIVTGALGYRFEGSKLFKYNSAILVDTARVVQYDKVLLVPFGEFFPFSNLLPFLKNISLGQGSFDRGEGIEPFTISGDSVAINICYEALFPTFIAKQSSLGDYLLNISNDGWYEGSKQIDQHNSFNIFRAIENRKAIVRVANKGRTGVILPTGEFRSYISPEERRGSIVEVGKVDDSTIFNSIAPYLSSIFNLLGVGLILYNLLFTIYQRFSRRGLERL